MPVQTMPQPAERKQAKKQGWIRLDIDSRDGDAHEQNDNGIPEIDSWAAKSKSEATKSHAILRLQQRYRLFDPSVLDESPLCGSCASLSLVLCPPSSTGSFRVMCWSASAWFSARAFSPD
ncbi:uncharacterized protein TrAtP1_002386 [Trichoderma atroviride]|uniref:uncharacterized protein n=1 Tax=Hypocrea atroviridis TaxID=63577 RepID=UPI003331D3BF|nr:hypothetical protein TrAtP1_002386 [Trichoderma atroviride]